MQAMQWIDDGAGKRCLRHGMSFGALEYCAGCVDDPGPEMSAELAVIPTAPEGCLTTVEIERELVADAATLKKLATDLNTDSKVKDTHLYNSLARLLDTRTKLLRAAAEMATRREDETVVADRLRRLREMRGSH